MPLIQTIKDKDLLPPGRIPHENWVKEKIAYQVLMMYKSAFINPDEQNGFYNCSKSSGDIFPIDVRLSAGCVEFNLKQLGPRRPALVFCQVRVRHMREGRETGYERFLVANIGRVFGMVNTKVFHSSTGPARRTRHDGVIPDGFVLKAAGQAYEMALCDFRRIRAVMVLDKMAGDEIELIGQEAFEEESAHVAAQCGVDYERMTYGAAMVWLDWLKWRHMDCLDLDPSDWINESAEKIFEF